MTLPSFLQMTPPPRGAQLLGPADLHGYQNKAIHHQCSMLHSALWLDMGLGKTIVTLTSIAHLIATGYLKAVIVVAPLRVCKTVWKQQAMEWSHTNHLTFANLTGSKDARLRTLLHGRADVYLINYENLQWLAETLEHYYLSRGSYLPFDGIVWDELSKMKNAGTKRVKAMMKVMPYIKWRTGLTGTPASNGYMDLHGQFLVLDDGARLGTSKTMFTQRFFYQKGQYNLVPFDDTEDQVQALIGDMTLQMSAEDYLDMPDLVVNDIEVDLPPTLRAKYEALEKDFFFQLDNGAEVEVFNKAALTNKCVAEGTEVLTERGWVPIEKYAGEKVWDGVEWVNTSGLAFQGYKFAVNCFGVLMTPDHRVLTAGGWKEAQEITNGESGERYDRQEVRLPYCSVEGWEPEAQGRVLPGVVGGGVRLRQSPRYDRTELAPEHSPPEVLRVQALRCGKERAPSEGIVFSRDDGKPCLGELVQHEVKVQQPQRQRLPKLRGPWDRSLRQMGQLIRGVLGRHGANLPGQFDPGTNGQRPRVLPGELSVEELEEAIKQQAYLRLHNYSSGENVSSPSGEAIQDKAHHDLQKAGEGAIRLRRNQTCRVYDLINAGPRHRFTVRGEDGVPLIVHNCLQFSNGAVYLEPGKPDFEALHDLKLQILEDVVEEAAGKPVLCAYAFKADAKRIMAHFTKKFPRNPPVNLTECKSDKALSTAMARWLAGDLPLMIGHPASMGHGIDKLQKNGNILFWYGLTWSLDLYDQFNARIRRQGQDQASVVCHRAIIKDTLDYAQRTALAEKAVTEDGLKNAVAEYRRQKGV